MMSHPSKNREQSPQGDPANPAENAVHVLALFVLAQAPPEAGISPVLPIIIAIILVLITIFAIMKVLKRPKKPEISERRETTAEDRIPTKDVLDDRMEVDEPVEITDDMSLAEIKRIKAARVTRKETAVRRETSKDATERAHREREEAEQAAKDAGEAIVDTVKTYAADKAGEEAPSEDGVSQEAETDTPALDASAPETPADEPAAQPERKISLKKPDFSKLAPPKPAASDEEDGEAKKPRLELKIPKPKGIRDEQADAEAKSEVTEAPAIEPEVEVVPEPEAVEPVADVAPAAEPEVAPSVEPDVKPEVEPIAPAQKTLAQGLAKTRGGFIGRLSGLFAGDELPEDMVDEVEEILFTADIGPRVASAILGAVQDGLSGDEMHDPAKIWGFIREYTSDLLKAHEQPLQIEAHKPFVMLVVGVNGAGKTTTIGKLASKLSAQGKKVLLVAGDTYRAGAVDQLAVWADRTDIPIHQGDDEADPSSVLFAGIERGIAEEFDVVICDTSGRLQTNVNLMDELAKMARVAGKALDGAPHETMLVLDANTGQNAIMQAQKFNDAVEITGISLTKLDGTARGGVILGICDQLDAPMRYIGIGESIEDLREFEADDFVDALFM